VAAARTVSSGAVFLRAAVAADATCRFSFSLDGKNFQPFGEAFTAAPDKWIGAKAGVFASAPPGKKNRGWADFDWFRAGSLFH
jgi:hypothetical protein